MRKSLWKRFVGKPNETHLAAVLKIIDDEIAQFNMHSHHDAHKIDDFKAAAVPKTECLFVLLAVSQRKGSLIQFKNPTDSTALAYCSKS
jgi:hypothetical protein